MDSRVTGVHCALKRMTPSSRRAREASTSSPHSNAGRPASAAALLTNPSWPGRGHMRPGNKCRRTFTDERGAVESDASRNAPLSKDLSGAAGKP